MKRFKFTTHLILAAVISLTACDSTTPKKSSNTNQVSNTTLDNAKVYNQNSQYSTALDNCILASKNKSCSLNDLPLIREAGTITNSSIEDRLVVSHKWMGDRFMQMLNIMQPDIKKLFGAVTAIVIDDNIHPAFYSTQTGAIYLDPRYLWLTPEEASTIEQKDDFRKNYGNDLKFVPAWRYVKNGKDVLGEWDLKHPVARTKEQIKINLERLLYHELSHANDFAAKSVIEGANRDKPIVEVLASRLAYTISSKLYDSMPLTNMTLKHLGQVLYMGSSSTMEDLDLSASDVGALFTSDSASNMYSYATQYEDYAMLFEAAMMKYHYNIDMDIGFVAKPEGAKHTCNDYIVEWGVRDRIANETVKPRVKFVLDSIFPEKSSQWSDFLNSLTPPKPLPTNVGWCDSLNRSDIKFRKTNKVEQTPIRDFLPPYL